MQSLTGRFSLSRGGARRDPAPSRWHYRWQRWMLTPAYRLALRAGVPCILALGIGSLWLSVDANRRLLTEGWSDMMTAVQDRPEFRVSALHVTGATDPVADAVVDLLDLDLPVSSFALDLTDIRSRVIALTAVRDVTVAVRAGGVLEVAVVERLPVALWRYSDGLRLIDAEGVMTGMVENRTDRPDLPLIAGDGAKDAITEALALFRVAEALDSRVQGLVRMGERRWDMVLDRDQRLLLPPDGAVDALRRVVALQGAQGVLDRDVTVFDLRNRARPTLRLSATAANVVRNVELTAAGAGGGLTGDGE